ncbi:MAG: hypothetical protein HP054_07525, partial [Blautia sp.]|nr:hypothetical protein [Blautia sp.]
EGSNRELMEQCQILREYAIYVARVRKYAKYMQLETAVQKAVDECIQEEILEEFLRKNRAEVIAVSIFEYYKEEEERKLRKAEFEAGEQSGIQKGIQEGIQEGKELKTKEIVNSLLQDGMGIEKIAALLKISKEHVLELAGRSKNL